MEVIKISPRGYCYGVVDAMVLAREAADNPDLPRPIYILGMIVHNQHAVNAFEQAGIITLDGTNRLELLDKVSKGTVIFTAHGVSPEVRSKAYAKGLAVIDATCPDVTKTHDLIREKVAQGYHIIYIGKKGHPEPEGSIGVAPERVHLVENVHDIEELNIESNNIVVTNQTTMSQWDTAALVSRICQRYPKAEVHNEICMATQLRQQAVADQAKGVDLCIVVGDPRSNNSNRLAEVAEQIAGVPSHRISDVSEIEPRWFNGKQRVAVTSGASTPTILTKEVIEYIQNYDANDKNTWIPKRIATMERMLPSKSPTQSTM